MTNVKLLFFGDFYCNSSPENIFSRKFLEELKRHDIVSCNFEGPVADPKSKRIKKAGSYLCQNKDSVAFLARNNIKLLNIANNHMFDYGKKGIENTLKRIKVSGIQKVGADVQLEKIYEPTILNLNGKRVGYLSFCEAEFGRAKYGSKDVGFAWINDPHVDSLILSVKKTVDILIVQAHAGVEDIELPLPEWRDRYRELVDLGADIIIGHHPHVPQGWEVYKKKYIFYSLGNFAFEYPNGEINANGFGVSIGLEKGKNIRPVVVGLGKKDGQICFVPNKSQSIKKLSRLLTDKDYEKRINKIALDLWENRYKQYYINSVGVRRGLIRSQYNQTNYSLLLHNIRIESHRWLVERALSILSQK